MIHWQAHHGQQGLDPIAVKESDIARRGLQGLRGLLKRRSTSGQPGRGGGLGRLVATRAVRKDDITADVAAEKVRRAIAEVLGPVVDDHGRWRSKALQIPGTCWADARRAVVKLARALAPGGFLLGDRVEYWPQ